MSNTKQIFQEDQQPHFIPRWTKEIKDGLEGLKPYQKKKSSDARSNIIINRIKVNTCEDEQSLDYSSYQDCLVGEGNFFKGRYEDWDKTKEAKRCDRCATLAGHQALFATSSLTNLYRFKDTLYTHFEESHKKTFQEMGVKERK